MHAAGRRDRGALGCATSATDLKIKGGDPLQGPLATKAFDARTAPAKAHAAQAPACTPGARTLSEPGNRVWPELGNGGYKSLHTDVFTVYDAPTNKFLPGNHVDLTQQATQCLSEFSLDFDRKNSISSTATTPGPDMTVSSITIDGVAGDVRAQAADLRRRPERPGRSRPARPRRPRTPTRSSRPTRTRRPARRQQRRRRAGPAVRRRPSS